jgi:archaemetzincin
VVWFEPRKRWRAEKILDAMAAEPPAGAWKVVAVTSAESSTTKDEYPDWRIAGLGSLDGQNCVLSTWIYRKHFDDQKTYDRRLADLTVHEFGHTLGLDHCETDACVMRDAMGKALESADTSTSQYCDKCRKQVGAGNLKAPPQ